MTRKTTMLKVLSALAALGFTAAAPTQAHADRLSFLLKSHHAGNYLGTYNENNLGVFYTWDGDMFDYTLGVYANSFYNTSVMAHASYDLHTWETGELSVFAGFSHYPERGKQAAVSLGSWVPVGGLQVRQGSLFMQFIPSDGNPIDYILAGGITFDLY